MNSKYAQMTRNLAANLPVFAHDKDHGQFTCITFIYISGFRAIGLVLNSGLFAKGGSEAASSGLEDGEEDSDSEGELDSELRLTQQWHKIPRIQNIHPGWKRTIFHQNGSN